MKTNEQTVFLTYDQAQDLVERIAKRAEGHHDMSEPEKDAMAQLLSDIGVNVSDIIDVSYLADNYAINAEIVTPESVSDYPKSSLQDALFAWEEKGKTYYCLSW